MKVQTNPPLHLTYCLNVHPGESWAENFAAIRDHALRVRDRVSPDGPFGLGMRLGAAAAGELSDPTALAEFRQFLTDEDLYVFTINGFPYGQFHNTAVKDSVYAPDWRTPQRRDYTIAMADILATLLPKDVSGSISTVPGSYKPWITCSDDVSDMVAMLCDVAAHLAALAAGDDGREIVLALEPEPDCYVETTDEVIAFFAGPLRAFGIGYLAAEHGLDAQEAEAVIGRHLGVCFDTSHLAVEFEDLPASLAALAAANVRIGKVHLSSALEVSVSDQARSQLADFCDPVYLHQVKTRLADGQMRSYADLPAALAADDFGDGATARVHFHVPLFFEGLGELTSTARMLTGAFASALRGGATEHLEIETYTFDVLPPELRGGDLADAVAREYAWARREILSP